MIKKMMLDIPLNRVEGDLEIRVEVKDGIVTDSWSSGTMYRGFENILAGRGPLDGLVITPRICGICSTTHLTAAARALDMIAGATVPDHARRIRNITLMVENVQSDMRHAFLLFAPDFANPAYQENPLFEEAARRYTPLKGETVIQTVRETKKILEIVAILGGQWPHSSFMVPGGVVSIPGVSDLLQCQHILVGFRKWYEERVLGCNLERWLAVDSLKSLDHWLEENEAHRSSELGFYIRFARSIGLDRYGKGHDNFLSFGSLELPQKTSVVPLGNSKNDSSLLIPAGYATGASVEAFDHKNIAEHVAHSWFVDYGGGRHPFDGETQPYATGKEGKPYSWAKAPRYNDLPAETGPLAEMVISANPLFTDLVSQTGTSVFVRQLARMVRPTTLIPAMEIWLKELLATGGEYYQKPEALENGQGVGLVQAARGALGHWVKIKDGRIARYQIITPTAWNGSPRDSNDVRGPWEEALVGVALKDPDNPVEVGHVIRSFDACLVCTVHTIHR